MYRCQTGVAVSVPDTDTDTPYFQMCHCYKGCHTIVQHNLNECYFFFLIREWQYCFTMVCIFVNTVTPFSLCQLNINKWGRNATQMTVILCLLTLYLVFVEIGYVTLVFEQREYNLFFSCIISMLSLSFDSLLSMMNVNCVGIVKCCYEHSVE